MIGNRDETPGLRIIPEQKIPPSLIEHHVEAIAVHSKSKGWVPAVAIVFVADDGSGFTCTMRTDDVVELVEIMLTAVERADIDITAAVINGYKP